MQKPIPLSYGADASGLICCYAFNTDGSRSLDSGALTDWLSQTDTSDELIWMHLNLSPASAELWLRQHLQLPETFFDALHEGVRATRIERADDALIAVMNDVLFDFSFDASDISTLWLAVTPRIVVTARLRPLRSIDRLRVAVKEGECFASTTAILVHLLRDQADVLTLIVRDIADKTDQIEDHLLANRLDQHRANLGTMRRLLVRLQRLLAPEPSALFRLLNRPPLWINDDDRQDLRQSTEEFATVIQEIIALQERIKLLQEEIAAQINEQTNRSLFVLTTVSVLALPINIIAGFLGMNVGGIPLTDSPHGFWVIVLIVASFTAVAVYWVFGRGRD
jgi:zinc transporter